MTNPFENVPLNTEQVYVMGKTKEGTEIYLPVASRDDSVINKKQAELQRYLEEAK